MRNSPTQNICHLLPSRWITCPYNPFKQITVTMSTNTRDLAAAHIQRVKAEDKSKMQLRVLKTISAKLSTQMLPERPNPFCECLRPTQYPQIILFVWYREICFWEEHPDKKAREGSGGWSEKFFYLLVRWRPLSWYLKRGMEPFWNFSDCLRLESASQQGTPCEMNRMQAEGVPESTTSLIKTWAG